VAASGACLSRVRSTLVAFARRVAQQRKSVNQDRAIVDMSSAR
jgi:hypothetical protein